MRCKKCDEYIPEGQFICSNCGYESPLMESREKYAYVVDKRRNAVLYSTKSLSFIVLAICFVLMALGTGALIIQGKIFMALPAVFILISVISMWMTVGTKKNDIVSIRLKYLSIFDVYHSILSWVLAVAFILAVLGGGAVLVIFLTNKEISADLKLTVLVGGIGVIVVGLIGAGISLLGAFVNKSRRKNIIELADYAETMQYSVEKVSTTGSKALGVLGIIGSIILVALGVLSLCLFKECRMVLEWLFGFINLYGEEAIISTIMDFLRSFPVELIAIGALLLLSGIYYIISGNWIYDTHIAILATRSFVSHETTRRLDLEQKTKAARDAQIRRSRTRNAELKIPKLEEKPDEESPKKTDNISNSNPFEYTILTKTPTNNPTPASNDDDDDYYDMYDIEG